MMMVHGKKNYMISFSIRDSKWHLCIGAAEGYYAVGLAKSFPDFEIYAYESNPIYLELLKDNATKNDTLT